MRIREFRELNESERDTLEAMINNTNGNISFALIGERAVIMLIDVSICDEEEKIKEAMEDAASETRSNMPDFTTTILDNGYGLVVIGRAGILTEEELSEEELEEGEMDFGKAITLWGDLLALCEAPELIAVAFAD